MEDEQSRYQMKIKDKQDKYQEANANKAGAAFNILNL